MTDNDSPVLGAIIHRIMVGRTDLLAKYGPQSILAAAEDVADWVGDVDEIGSSDVSGWVKQVERMLEENPPEAFGVKEDVDPADVGEYDREGDMAKSDLRSIMLNASRLHDMLGDSDNLPEWVQSKLTVAEDYLSTVVNYLASQAAEPMADMPESAVTEAADVDLRAAVTNVIQAIYKGAVAGSDMIDDVADELGDYFDAVEQSNDEALQNAYSLMRDEGADAEGNPEQMAAVAKRALAMLQTGKSLAEGANDNLAGILARHADAVEEFKQGGDMSYDLESDLWDYYFSRGDIRNYDADASGWIAEQLADYLGLDESVAEGKTGNAGYDSMLAVMKAVDAGKDATFDIAGEPITLEYPEARFLAGKYKAFLKAGRQEEFLKYMENPVTFDRLMKQLRDLIDKQKNFRGSVPGERGVTESNDKLAKYIANYPDEVSANLNELKKKVEAEAQQSNSRFNWAIGKMPDGRYVSGLAGAIKTFGLPIAAQGSSTDFFEAKQTKNPYAIGMAQAMKSTGDEPPLKKSTIKKAHKIADAIKKANESLANNEYWCDLDKKVKLVPEGYKKLATGYITRI